MHTATTATDLGRILDASRVGFELTRVPAASAEQWHLSQGALQHTSKGFFSVNGVVVDGEERLLLYQPQSAITGLLTTMRNGERQYLLQARAEPGCLGEAQFGPTLQSTPANYLRLHGGDTTPYADAFVAFHAATNLIDDTIQLDLGERYLFKSKRSILAETTDPGASDGAYIWASGEAVCDSLSRSAFFNIDLRSILAVATWDVADGAGGLTPRSDLVKHSLMTTLRTEVMGSVVTSLQRRARNTRFVPLQDMANWKSTLWGLEERQRDQGFAIDFFHVKAALREVRDWTQPLVNSVNGGRVTLACREQNGVLTFQVRSVRERGLATAVALAPSYVRYPGATDDEPKWLDNERNEIWIATTESDEGGRFYQDASRYEIIKVAPDVELSEDDLTWLTLSEIKAFLRMSNVCTIQLRGVISLLLAAQ